MTGKSLWQNIKALVECDAYIATYTDEIMNLKQSLDEEHAIVEKSNAMRQGQQKTTFTLQKNLQLKELSAKELKAQEEHKRSQLEQIKDQKSYMALEREIEILSKKRAHIEEDLLKELYNFDTATKDVQILEQKQSEKCNVMLHDIAVKTENLQRLEQKLATQIAMRSSIIPTIQPEWYAQYERMKGRVPDPIVPIINTSCSGCFYTLPHQELSRAKRGDLIVCRSCYRFVYYNAEEASEAHQAQY